MLELTQYEKQKKLSSLGSRSSGASGGSRKKEKKEAGRKSSGLNKKEREAMIVKYAHLVKHIAGRMAMRIPSNVLFDELVSAGCMGLIDAVDKFDPLKEVDLKTYAAYRIKGAILDELRSMDWYSRSMRKKIQDLEKALMAVETREGRPAEDWQVARELGIELEEYFKTLSDIHGVALLNMNEYIKDVNNDILTNRSFQDRVLSKDDPAENLARGELKRVVADAITTLSEKERTVISLYYYEELTLKEIGVIMELTESRICQIHTMALIKLKTRLKGYIAK